MPINRMMTLRVISLLLRTKKKNKKKNKKSCVKYIICSGVVMVQLFSYYIA